MERVANYMLADVPGRLYWLRLLVVDFSPVSRDSTMILATLLKQATNLRSLTIYNVDTLLESTTEVGDALAALPNLVNLELWYVGSPRTCEVLQKLQSQPKSLLIGTAARLAVHDHAALFRSLDHLQAIRSLILEHRYAYGDTSKTLDERDIQGSWPSVHELSLQTGSRIPISVLVPAYPNVRVLILQEYIQTHRQPTPRCWDQLDYVEADIRCFEHWQLTCPVFHLHITSVLSTPSRAVRRREFGEGDPPMLLPVLRNALPVFLVIPILQDAELNTTSWSNVAQFGYRMRCLEVGLCASSMEEDALSASTSWIVSNVLSDT